MEVTGRVVYTFPEGHHMDGQETLTAPMCDRHQVFACQDLRRSGMKNVYAVPLDFALRPAPIPQVKGEHLSVVRAYSGMGNRGEPLWRHACGQVESFPEAQKEEIGGGCDACESGSDDPEDWQPVYIPAPAG